LHGAAHDLLAGGQGDAQAGKQAQQRQKNENDSPPVYSRRLSHRRNPLKKAFLF
jgi:hypothetical protein